MITTTNYKNGRENFHDCFLRIKFFDYKINILCCTLWGGGQEKRTFCTLVKMLINVYSPLLTIINKRSLLKPIFNCHFRLAL